MKFNTASYIIGQFGGRQALCDSLGENYSYHLIRSWETAGHIPEKHRLHVLTCAARDGINVTAFDFIRHLVSVKTA